MEESINNNRHKQYRVQRRDNNPSFSSTLLDVIYRSIDERDDDNNNETMRKKRQCSIDTTTGCFQLDNNNNQSIPSVRRNAAPKNTGEAVSVVRRKSDIIASACSSGYAEETMYGFPSRPRPIRTSTTSSIKDDYEFNFFTRDKLKSKPKLKQSKTEDDDLLKTEEEGEGKFVKTKSRAMKKIYGYLNQRKQQQPDSPGARLANFLISLFTGTGNPNKSKISSISSISSSCTGRIHDDIIQTNRKSSKSADLSTTTSSSATTSTSFSRSILTKTCSKTPPLTTTTTTGGMKRSSVRFYPDDYNNNKPNNSLHGNRNRSESPSIKLARKSFNEEIKRHFTEKNCQIEETTRKLLKNYQKKVEFVFDSIKLNTGNEEDYDEDDDEDEARSYDSSDLFELDHLTAIGKDLCMEELPLYETTSIDANRAIAKGCLLE